MQEYEIVLKKMIRRERYLVERDCKHGLIYFGSENELHLLHPILDEDGDEDNALTDFRIKALAYAMRDLKVSAPKQHELICRYYLGEPVSKTHLGELYGVSRQAVSKSLKKAVIFLRTRAELYLAEMRE